MAIGKTMTAVCWRIFGHFDVVVTGGRERRSKSGT